MKTKQKKHCSNKIKERENKVGLQTRNNDVPVSVMNRQSVKVLQESVS